MQSKRLIEQLRRQDWVAVAIEFIIVVVGVLLAMQVANWNEQRLEHERGRAYYQRILTELRSNISDMDQRAAYYEQVIGHADAALVAFHDPASSLGEPLLVDLYQASQIQTGPITRASYDEAISSGALLSVGGPQLRVRLANYFSLAESSQMIYDETTPYRDRIRGLLPDAVQMRIQADCNDITSIDAQGMTSATLPTQCALHLTPQQVAQAIAVVRAAPDLEVDLTRWLSSLRQRVIQFRSLSNHARELADTMATRQH